jgi:hypothetical protein
MNHEAKAVLSDTSETLGLCKDKDNTVFKQKKRPLSILGKKEATAELLKG